jgi:hypothetical protein
VRQCHRLGIAVEILGSKTTRLVVLCAFDLLELAGNDLRRNLLEVRKTTVSSGLAKVGPGLRLNEHMEGDGKTVFVMGPDGMAAAWLTLPFWKIDDYNVKNPAAPAVKRKAEED